jgi:hypothetical protein
MQSKGSSPRSQESATGLYLQSVYPLKSYFWHQFLAYFPYFEEPK